MFCFNPMSVFVSWAGLTVAVRLRLVLNTTSSYICLPSTGIKLNAYATHLAINTSITGLWGSCSNISNRTACFFV